MDNYHWQTERPHFDNTETMQDFLDCELGEDMEIDVVDGSYAEVRTKGGVLFGVNAAGNGDSYNHVVVFERIS